MEEKHDSWLYHRAISSCPTIEGELKELHFQSISAPRSTGPLDIDCHEYNESAARHQELRVLDENGSTRLSGVISSFMGGMMSFSDIVCSGFASKSGSILLGQTEFIVGG
jgi:hypothetical protein